MSISVVDQLFKKVKKDKGINAPKFSNYPKNFIHQADILYLPNDNGYKYLLVVVDIGSRLTDAEPLKNRTSSNTVQAFEKIYKRKILELPKKIEFDNGSEFKGETKKWFEDKNIVVKYKKPYRHRQQAIVERRNQIIGKELFKRMTEEELQTGQESKQWKNEIKEILKNMNGKQKKIKIKKPSNDYQCSGDACTIIPQGTQVRVALDHPVNVFNGKKLSGKFRDSDIRYEIRPKTVTHTILQPNQPPLYIVNDDHNQAYTKNQLMIVKDNEKQPEEKKIRPIKKIDKMEVYNVEKLLSRKKIKNKIMFEVKWVGFKNPTWEPRSNLIKDVKNMVLEFEKNLKNKK